jgi:hypothetical protein
MELHDIRLWFAAVSELVDTVTERQTEQLISQAHRDTAKSLNQVRLETHWDAKYQSADEAVKALLGLLWSHTGRTTLDQISELLVDVRVRYELCTEAYAEWRRLVAIKEYYDQAGYDDGDASVLQESIDRARKKFDIHVVMTQRLCQQK